MAVKQKKNCSVSQSCFEDTDNFIQVNTEE
jgi:hypothetical protein